MASNAPTPPCRLCGQSTHHFHSDKRRPYYQCDACGMVMVTEAFFLSEQDEKKEYDLHENGVLDDGYRKFLSRTAEPLREYLDGLAAEQPSGSSANQPVGLDFGSGPFPALVSILQAPPYNYRVMMYDKYYCASTEYVLDQPDSLDFVTATEVVEHLRDPLSVLKRLWKTLKPNGALVIMTKRVDGTIEKFRNWHYIRDPTHITFFHAKSFEWLAKELPAQGRETCTLRFPAADVVLLIKHCV